MPSFTPDDKTIADFRKDNGPAIKKVCAQFVELSRKMGLLTSVSVAIAGLSRVDRGPGVCPQCPDDDSGLVLVQHREKTAQMGAHRPTTSRSRLVADCRAALSRNQDPIRTCNAYLPRPFW